MKRKKMPNEVVEAARGLRELCAKYDLNMVLHIHNGEAGANLFGVECYNGANFIASIAYICAKVCDESNLPLDATMDLICGTVKESCKKEKKHAKPKHTIKVK